MDLVDGSMIIKLFMDLNGSSIINGWFFHGKSPMNDKCWLVVTGTMEFAMTFPSCWECHNPN